MRLFAYGTLKKGFYFHEEYLGNGKGTYVCDGHTGPGFTLYVDALPNMAVDRDGVGVKGEIYEVDQEALKRIDDLEGHPTHYRREIIEITDNDGNVSKCWAYLRPKHLFTGRPGVTTEEAFT